MKYILTALVCISSICFSKEEKPRVLGLSAALLDQVLQVSDSEFYEVNDLKGERSLFTNYPSFTKFSRQYEERSSFVPGGSGLNVIKGLSSLGIECSVLGKVGSDERGEMLMQSLEEKGIAPHLQKGSLPTGQVICFVTPDGQRTFVNYLGASHSDDELIVHETLFEDISLFHVEGYQVLEGESIVKALTIAKKCGAKISLDLAHENIVKNHADLIWNLIQNYVDYLFANEQEAYELTGLDPRSAAIELAKHCSAATVTMSADGCYSACKEEIVFAPAKNVPVLDTTGAGDLFASGFLFGMLTDKSLETCCEFGSVTASHVIQHLGAEVPRDKWPYIADQLVRSNLITVSLDAF